MSKQHLQTKTKKILQRTERLTLGRNGATGRIDVLTIEKMQEINQGSDKADHQQRADPVVRRQ